MLRIPATAASSIAILWIESSEMSLAANRTLAFERGEENRAIELDLPEGVGIGRNGEVYTIDTGNHRFIQYNTNGLPALIRGEFGRAMEQFRDPTDLAVDTRG